MPLDGEREKTREFLLVPYFGACIHAPAPPANQVIHVVVSKDREHLKLTPAAFIYDLRVEFRTPDWAGCTLATR